MAYRIKLTKKGSVRAILNDIKTRIRYVQKGQEIFSRKTANHMARVISDNTKRKPSTGALAKSIKSYVDWGGGISPTGGNAVFSVGRKPDLPIYWAAVNYGGIIPGGGKFVRGSFDGEGPVAGGDGVRFGKDNRRGAGMRAKHFIRPMNYIEKTQAWFNMEWPKYSRNRMSKRK